MMTRFSGKPGASVFKTPAQHFYLIKFASAFLFSLVFTVNLVYHAKVVGLSPLQLVLVGTVLELTVFLFETPTGLLADLKSRKWSVVIGFFLIGLGFLLEASVPLFFTVLIAQVLWGIGYTFTSGALQAWIADEHTAGSNSTSIDSVFVKGDRMAALGNGVAIPFSVWVALTTVQLPILLGGACFILLSIWLAFSMTENGFQRSKSPRVWQQFHSSWTVIKGQHTLWIIAGITIFLGLYSEGFDRLWTPHFIDNLQVPTEPLVIFFGILRAIETAILFVLLNKLETQIADQNQHQIKVSILWLTTIIIASLVVFAWSPWWIIAALAYLAIQVTRSYKQPILTTWINRNIEDTNTRASIFSFTGQLDALGQISGGPIVGLIGNLSIRIALTLCALLLLPVYLILNRVKLSR